MRTRGLNWPNWYKWVEYDPANAEQYTRAMEARAEGMADEMLDIADFGVNDTYEKDGIELTNHDVIARSRLRVDTRRWLLGKLAPKKYGDKVTQEHTGAGGGPIQTQTIDPSKLSTMALTEILGAMNVYLQHRLK